MKKNIIYLLLPLCVAFLPACSKSYTLTLISSDTSCGTVTSEVVKYKAGSKVKVEAELVQGYTVSKWVDDLGNKIGSLDSFEYTMPSRNATLTASFKYAKFKLNLSAVMEADEKHYDFKEFFERNCFSLSWRCNDNRIDDLTYSEKVTWHDEVNLIFQASPYSGSAPVQGFFDEEGTKLGDTDIIFEMPNYDYNVYLKFRSQVKGVVITGSGSKSMNSSWIDTSSPNGMCLSYGEMYMQTIPDDYAENFKVEFRQEYCSEYVFDYWYDLDEEKIVSNDPSFTVDMTDVGVKHYEFFVHKA